MSTENWEAGVLGLVGAADYRPVKPRVLAKRLGITEDEKSDFKRLIKKLVKRGKLAYGANHLIAGAPAVASASPPPNDGQQGDGQQGDGQPAAEKPAPPKSKHSGTTVTGTFRRCREASASCAL